MMTHIAIMPYWKCFTYEVLGGEMIQRRKFEAYSIMVKLHYLSCIQVSFISL